MEIFAHWLNPAQWGQLREAVKVASPDQVADVATTSIRSMGAREDSLVFILGLLNLSTILCYAVYSQLFKPGRSSPAGFDENHVLFKKIQSVLDDLVLHVHTNTYYRNALESDVQENPAAARPKQSPFQGRSVHSIKSFFNLFDYHRSGGPSLAVSSTLRAVHQRAYDAYLKREVKKMAGELLATLHQLDPSSGSESSARTKRQAPQQLFKRRKLAVGNATAMRKRPLMAAERVQQFEKPPVDVKEPSAQSSSKRPIATNRRAQKPSAIQATGGHDSSSSAEIAADQPDIVSSSISKTPEQKKIVPVLPVHISFPHLADTVSHREDEHEGRSSSSRSNNGPRDSLNQRATESLQSAGYHTIPTALLASHDEMNFVNEGGAPVQQNFVGRLMELIGQTTPLTMDVLDVFKTRLTKANSEQLQGPKCLERLLCQLNQDWKQKGAVPAALAPFLSITTGWLADGVDLSHILMATRAGWIGKQCSTLYPRCTDSNPIRWTLAAVPDDSLDLPSLAPPPIRVRPPADFPKPSTTPLISPSKNMSSSLKTIHSLPTKPIVAAPELWKPTGAPVTATSDLPPSIPTAITTEWTRSKEEDEEEEDDEENEEDSEEENYSNNEMIAVRAEDTNAGSADSSLLSGQYIHDRIDEGPKPWGKPTRFAVSQDVPLSDIVRGVYTPATSSGEDLDGEEIDDDEEDEDQPTEQPTTSPTDSGNEGILHDLNAHHFVEVASKPVEASINVVDAYHEAQKKKTHRLEMVPHRGLVHPWMSEPVWVPQSVWPLNDNSNYLRSNAEFDDLTDRHRDLVSFSQEDAVKDSRLLDFTMQYLRDRSA